MGRGRSLFSLEATSAETAFGFEIVDGPSGAPALTYRIGVGLRAVKMRRADGATEYAICDERLAALYVPAKTLAEIEERFRRQADRARIVPDGG